MPVVLASSAKLPWALLKLPLLVKSAKAPTALLRVPLSLNSRAAVPTAVLLPPVVFNKSAAPTAVLKLASVLAKSAYQPNAEFPKPLVLLNRAWSPSAVLNGPTVPGTGSGVCWAIICWQSGKLTSAEMMVPNMIFRFFIVLIFLSLFLAFLLGELIFNLYGYIGF